MYDSRLGEHLGVGTRLKQSFGTSNIWVRSSGPIGGEGAILWMCEQLRNAKHQSHLTVCGLGEGKQWCFRDDSALPLKNSRKVKCALAGNLPSVTAVFL